ncbi:MAG: hypothetical protein HY695_08200 [Deltaproteobacteria bacterium]|nr:hypothetical protein [Deltaproteobacteria bacterium]
MNINCQDLVQLIVWYASSRGEKLTTLRLVKFLYLADLYYARVSKGKTLTGWPWAFVYFGPWCRQVNETIENAAKDGLVLTKEYPSKYDDDRDYRLFWIEDTDEEPKIIDTLPTYVWSRLRWAIQKWADDSYGLLDYVYFETEPMIAAKRGSALDFTKAEMPEVHKKVEMKRIPDTKIQEAKKAIDRLKEKYSTAIVTRPAQGPVDSIFREAIQKLEENDLETGLEGTAELGDLDPDQKP